MSYTSEVQATEGEPIPGTFTISVDGQTPGNAPQNIGTSEFPLDVDGSGGDQWAYFSPLTTIRTGWTTLQFDTESITPIPKKNPDDPTTFTSQRIRCDRAQEVNNGTGCVNPGDINVAGSLPTVVYPTSDYPFIVPNIRNGQFATGEGNPGSASPLNRGPSGGSSSNRDAACGSSQAARLRNIGGPPPADMIDPSCDEYPFASTTQGGSGASVAWVPLAENTAQGLLMIKFYRESRVMDGDAFYVRA